MTIGELTNDSTKTADSSAWVDYLRKSATPAAVLLDDLLGRETVIVGDLVLFEVLRGFTNDLEYARVRRDMLEFDVRPMVTPDIALKAAVNYRTLRRKGITVRKAIDCLIATWCIDNGIALLHSDRDFDPFEQHLGLRVVR